MTEQSFEFYEHAFVHVDELIPYAMNSRTHSDAQVAQIAASIREFGFTNPVLIDEANNLIAGHGRVLAARKLKMDVVPAIIVTGLDENRRRALVIADNQLALNAEWDQEKLIAELQSMSVDMQKLTGINDEELLAMMKPAEIEGLTDEDAAPEPPEKPVTVLGDVWLLGRHRLMCGDATSIEQMEQLCEGRAVDMWLTDPPYNVGYQGGTKDKLTIQNDNMSDGDFRQFLRDAYSAADAVLRPGGVFYVWHADSEGFNFRGAAADIGWTVRQCLVWKKSSLVLGRQDYQWIHEPCLYGWKDGAAHHWASDRSQTTVLEFARPSRNGEHPTMKPVELFAYQMQNNTKPNDLVLDSFAGSGTTAIACEKHGRNARLMELDPRYCDVIIKRWQDFTGETAILEGDGRIYDQLKQEREAA